MEYIRRQDAIDLINKISNPRPKGERWYLRITCKSGKPMLLRLYMGDGLMRIFADSTSALNVGIMLLIYMIIAHSAEQRWTEEKTHELFPNRYTFYVG